MKDTPKPKETDNMGMFLFQATFTLQDKSKNINLEEKIRLLARDEQHFVNLYGYQKKLSLCLNLANKGNYSLLIEICQV